MKDYYKKEKKVLNSPKRTIPIPRGKIGSNETSPTNEAYSSNVGVTGNML